MRRLKVVIIYLAIIFHVVVQANDLVSTSFHHFSIPIPFPHSFELDNVQEPFFICLKNLVEGCENLKIIWLHESHALCIVRSFIQCLNEHKLNRDKNVSDS